MSVTPPRQRSDIAFFLPGLYGGGVEKMSLNLAHIYRQQGLAVDMVLVKEEGERLNEVPAGANVIGFNAPAPIAAIPQLAQYLRQQRPRAMFSGITSINLAAIIAAKLAGVDTTIVVSERVAISKNIQTHPLKRLFPPLIRQFYPHASQIVAVSRGLADDLSSVTGIARDDITVIYNPVVTPQMLNSDPAPPDHAWFPADEVPVILGVGRLVEQKHFETLIRAFAHVETDSRLMILGEGEQRPQLEALVRELDLQERVQMPGFVDAPIAYMRHASVFALSSIYEGLGNVVIEALAAGCPVVSTDCPFGPSEILADGDYGTLVPVRDPQALARAIDDTLATPPDREVLRERARDFSAERIAAKYSELFFDTEPTT